MAVCTACFYKILIFNSELVRSVRLQCHIIDSLRSIPIGIIIHHVRIANHGVDITIGCKYGLNSSVAFGIDSPTRIGTAIRPAGEQTAGLRIGFYTDIAATLIRATACYRA